MKALKAAKKTPATLMDLYAVLPELRKTMRKPLGPLRVVVIDDSEKAVSGIISVLLQWPNIFTVTIIQQGSDYPDVQQGRDNIVLLDEKMPKMTGTKVLEYLKEDGFEGVVASISSDMSCPPAFQHHFPNKCDIGRSKKTAFEFVEWMNELIFQAEQMNLAY